MAKKYKEIKDDSSVFRTETGDFKKVSEEFKETIDSSLSFDPIDLTMRIIDFGKALTGVNLYTYQIEPAFRIIYSVITVEGANLTMLFSRQSGKSECVAFVIDTLATILPILATFFPELEQYKDGIKIGLFAPQSDQVDTTYSRAMLRMGTENAEAILSDPEIDTWLESEVRLELSNGSFLKGQIASKQSKIESKTYDLVFLEESQDIDSYICQKSIEPMVSATNGTIVKVGTTGTTKDHFWNDIQENRRMARGIADERLRFHFEFDYKAVIASKRKQYDIDKKLFHLNYEKDVLKKRKRWGEDSDAFRLSYALQWALESGMFISDKDWDSLLNRKKGIAKKPEKEWYVVAGLDIGKSQASTVLTIGIVHQDTRDVDVPPAKDVVYWFEMQGDDYEIQHYALVEELLRWQVEVLYADYTGVGKPVVDRLAYAVGESITIIPYTFSRPSKSDMWVSLQNDIRNRRLKIPANESARKSDEFRNFEKQLKDLQKWYEGSFLVAEKPSDEPDAKDDYCDSLALMVMAGNHLLPEEFEVEDEDNPLLEELNRGNQLMRQASW